MSEKNVFKIFLKENENYFGFLFMLQIENFSGVTSSSYNVKTKELPRDMFLHSQEIN
jgi:hypothetical protein